MVVMVRTCRSYNSMHIMEGRLFRTGRNYECEISLYNRTSRSSSVTVQSLPMHMMAHAGAP